MVAAALNGAGPGGAPGGGELAALRGKEADADDAADAASVGGSSSSSSELVHLEPAEPWYGHFEAGAEHGEAAGEEEAEEASARQWEAAVEEEVEEAEARQREAAAQEEEGEVVEEAERPPAPPPPEEALAAQAAPQEEDQDRGAPAAPVQALAAPDFEADTASLFSYYLGPNAEVDLGLEFRPGDRCRWPVLEVRDPSWGRANGVRPRDELCRVNGQSMEVLGEEEVFRALAGRPLTFSFARQSASAAPGLLSPMACLAVEPPPPPPPPPVRSGGGGGLAGTGATASRGGRSSARGHGGEEAAAPATAPAKARAPSAQPRRSALHPTRGEWRGSETWRAGASEAVCPAHLALPAQRGGRLRWAGLGLLDEELPSASALPSIGIRADSVKELDLSKNKLTGAFLPRLLSPCRRLTGLRTVKLFANALGDGSAAFLADVCLRCPALLEMHLSHNLLTVKGVCEIVPAACRGSAQRRALAGAKSGTPPFWLRLEHNAIEEPLRLFDFWRADRLPVCRLHRGCSSACCRGGMELHLPYFSNQGRPGSGAEVEGPPPVRASRASRPSPTGWPAAYPAAPERRPGPGWFGPGPGQTYGQAHGQGHARAQSRGQSRGVSRGLGPRGRRSHSGTWRAPSAERSALRGQRRHPEREAGRQAEKQGSRGETVRQVVPHVSSCGLLGDKPHAEPLAAPAAPEPRSVVRLPRAAAGLGEERLEMLALGSGVQGLERLREQHPLCRIDLVTFADDARRARPAFVVRPATSTAGPVATSIAMGKAVRDAEGLVEALRPLLCQGPQLALGGRPQVFAERGLRERGAEEDARACLRATDAARGPGDAEGVW